MAAPKEIYFEQQARTIIRQLAKRQMEGFYVRTKEEALAKVCQYLTPDVSVACGGSMTLGEIGLPQAIKESGCTFYDRFAAQTPEEKRAIFGLIATADYYFMSTNAITLDGILVNIDGTGNRVASLIHGPQSVIIIAGMNKVATDVKAAVDRVRNMAAPPNCVRLNCDTPCAKTGRCMDCQSPSCICDQIVITRRSFIANRIKVILVGESLGY